MSSKACCWCNDKRADRDVTKFVDGVGMVGIKWVPRDVDYCSSCRLSEKSFSAISSEILLKIDLDPSFRRQIDDFICDANKRAYRKSKEYMQERSERTYEGIKWRRLGARNLLRGKFK
jgi:hypothetical protein